MTITTPPEPAAAPGSDDLVDNNHKPMGYGRMLRKEDPRFIRGLGRYCDDVQLPGMLHMAILRSPVAHAKILNIDTTAAGTSVQLQWDHITQNCGSRTT